MLDPAATDVQPDIPSPILPQPFVSILTLLDPDAIGAACAAQGGTFGARACFCVNVFRQACASPLLVQGPLDRS